MDGQALQRLTAGDPAVFEQLVDAMGNPTNEIRTQAEAAYANKLESHPAVMVRLLTAGLGHDKLEMKNFCSVMLRKVNRPATRPDSARCCNF